MRRLAHALTTLVLGIVLVTLFHLSIADQAALSAERLPAYAVVLAAYLAVVAVIGVAAAAILRRRSPTDRIKQRLLDSVFGATDGRGRDQMVPTKARRG